MTLKILIQEVKERDEVKELRKISRSNECGGWCRRLRLVVGGSECQQRMKRVEQILKIAAFRGVTTLKTHDSEGPR